ncbi:MAG: peptidylprolyl isomerase [Candidatus Cloacimonetes bacterium]|nr:peptidylprolyl isomerase [Candidatus Cloacimonadota bacterium]
MLEDLRKNQKWIIWAIAIIFIAGMGLMGIMSIFNPTPSVGSIYGKKIYLQDYDRMFRQNVQQYQYQNQDANIDDQALKNINDQTWEQNLSRIVMDRQLKKYRIKVSDQDVLNKIKNDPPAELHQNPEFLTNGAWDQQKYMSILANNVEFALVLEDYVRQLLPYEKLEKKIKDQLVVTVDSVRVDWLEKNDKVSAKVINLDWNSIETQEVSDAEIKAFYDKNKNNYKKEAARKYRYVTLKLEPSDYDIQRAKEDIDYVYDQLIKGGDFAELAAEYSQDPSNAQNGGSLGFFGRGRMVPEFDTIAFESNVGDLSVPFKTQFGWHIMQVTGKRDNEQGEPEVEANHILIKTEASELTKIDLRSTADRIASIAERTGLEKAVEGMELEIRETPELFTTSRSIPGIGNFPNLVSEAFSKRLGFVPPAVSLNDGSFAVLELSYIKGAHIQDLELVTEVVKREVDKEKRTNIVLEKTKEFMAKHTPDEYLEYAAEYGFKVVDANERLVTQSISGIGMDRKLMNVLFTKEAGEWTEIISTDRGNFLALVTERHIPNMDDFFANQETLTSEYKQRKESTHYSQWYQKVKEEADIKDLRYQYY